MSDVEEYARHGSAWRTQRIPAGTLMRRTSAPTEEYVVTVAAVDPGDEHAEVRYFGGQGNKWTERTANLAPPAFKSVVF